MKNKLIKNSIKEIRNTFKRFLSILVMALLGVGFFAGLTATEPDMIESLDTYYDQTNLYDISVLSTLGLTQEDVEAVKQIEGIEQVYSEKSKDAIIHLGEKEYVANIIEYHEKQNTPILKKGVLPQTTGECAVEVGFLENSQYQLGDTIQIEDPDNVFQVTELKIVGEVQSPAYISHTRGNTTLGTGTINYYLYVPQNSLNLAYETALYANVIGAKEEITNSEAYKKIVEEAKQKIEGIKEERQQARQDQLVKEANDELEKAKKELEEQKQEGETKLADARKQIEDGQKALQDAQIQINQNQATLNTNKNKAQQEFQKASNQISQAQTTLEQKEKELETAKVQWNQKKQEAQAGIKQMDEGIAKTNTTLLALQEQKKQMEATGMDTTQIVQGITKATDTLAELKKQKAQIEASLTEGEKQITEGETSLANGKKQLEEQKTQFETTKRQTNQTLSQAQVKIDIAQTEVNEKKQELEKARQELEANQAEFDIKIADAQNEIEKAQNEITKIEKAKWYIYDRSEDEGYASYTQSTQSISNIAKVFPIVFYMIAVLISLTSMTRMVEEERIEIGTLKALGYSNGKIIFKYMLYASLACIIGGFIGMCIGFLLIPSIVYSMYQLLYDLPSFYPVFRWGIGFIGLLLSFICIGGATFLVSYKELQTMPATLMRPKAPKNGKRVFLERITCIWKRLKFSQKVTIRNLFRYKKRVLMTIIGIAGCTALILTGFGIKDSIGDIVTQQFGRVFDYDVGLTIKADTAIAKLKTELQDKDAVQAITQVNISSGTIQKEGNTKAVKIMVPEKTEDFEKMVHLYPITKERKNQQTTNVTDDGVIITDKLAELLKITVGDTITLFDSDELEHEFRVDQIVENYVDHYVFLSKKCYETNIKAYETNMMMLDLTELSKDEMQNISSELMQLEGVSGIIMTSSMVEQVEDMLSSLNYVVLILIVASALLAFTVLYNLSNVNISERKREIATLKVLGFYHKEVDSYINKESIILTAIGIILGLGIGFFLCHFIITTCEIESLRFVKQIKGMSFLYAAAITTFFTLIVNWIVHFSLKKVDMIESLKSVE